VKTRSNETEGDIARDELIVGHLSGAITPEEPVNFLPR